MVLVRKKMKFGTILDTQIQVNNYLEQLQNICNKYKTCLSQNRNVTNAKLIILKSYNMIIVIFTIKKQLRETEQTKFDFDKHIRKKLIIFFCFCDIGSLYIRKSKKVHELTPIHYFLMRKSTIQSCCKWKIN